MKPQSNITEGGDSAERGWLASMLLQRGGEFLPRLAFYYRQLAARPRSWRRQLRRKLAVTVTGAAMLLAMAGPISWSAAQAETETPAATIIVVNQEVTNVTNNRCGLIEAIINAQATTSSQLRPDCAAGNLTGSDTVSLPADGEFVLNAAHNAQYGPTGLPYISKSLTIEGHGATIRRDASATTPRFRIIAVNYSGELTLRDVTISGGYLDIDDPGSNFGGGVYNAGSLTLDNSAVVNNDSEGGGGIHNLGSLTMIGSEVRRNDGYYAGAGGIENLGSATISGSLIAENFTATDEAGGIHNTGHLTMFNSTVANNYAPYGSAGGINNEGTARLKAITVTRNVRGGSPFSPSYGGGITNTGDLTLERSIVSGNSVLDDLDSIHQSEIANHGVISSNHNNVFGFNGNSGIRGDTAGVVGASDIVPDVPLAGVVGTLTDHGGVTWSVNLPADSPAIDLVPNSQCANLEGFDQRDRPRNVNGDGVISSHECDAGAFERQFGPDEHTLFLSAAKAGTVGGIAFQPADILRYEPGEGWSLFLDASIFGIKKNVTAFEIEDNGTVRMVLASNQLLPTGDPESPMLSATPFNIITFTSGLHQTGRYGWFTLFAKGSEYGLSAAGEKIDALGEPVSTEEVPDYMPILVFSTSGAAGVYDLNDPPTSLKAQDEDAISITGEGYVVQLFFNGTAIKGMGVEDLTGLWIDQATGDLYISMDSNFKLGGFVVGESRDIVKLTPTAEGTYMPSLWWDGSVNRFPVAIDAIEIMP